MGNKNTKQKSTTTRAKKLKDHPVDLKIFEDIKTQCNESDVQIVSNCSFLERLTIGLKHYYAIINDAKESKQKYFMQFCDEIYLHHLLDDFAHFTKQHGSNEQLIQIEKELQKTYGFEACNIFQCNKMKRHYRKREDSNHTDNNFGFYCDFYDKIHYHLFHLFDTALRTNINKNITHNINNDNIFVCSDKIFEKRSDLIRTKRKQYGLNSERFKQRNNKYNLYISDTPSKPEIYTYTLLDKIFEIIEQKEAIRFMEYIHTNEYDSDAVKYDLPVNNDNSHSNIGTIFHNKQNMNAIINYIKFVELSSKSFSTGLVFYYWDYYKHLSQDEVEKENVWCNSRHNGYSIKDLFVLPYYSSLKNEILSSGFITIQQWDGNISLKAIKYYQCNKVKNIKASYRVTINNHGIKQGDSLKMDHILCIIIYCDWTDLQSDFSNTFRISQFETMKALKKCNSKYY
eukprot:169317_1